MSHGRKIPMEAKSVEGIQVGKLIIPFRVTLEKKKNLSNLENIDEYQLSAKKDFKYNSIGDMREKMPLLESTKSVFELADLGVEDIHMSFFTNFEWKDKIS